MYTGRKGRFRILYRLRNIYTCIVNRPVNSSTGEYGKRSFLLKVYLGPTIYRNRSCFV